MESPSPSPGISKSALCFYAIMALGLGMGSVWIPVTAMDIARGLLYGVFVFFTLWLFISWLPHIAALPVQILVAMVSGVFAGWLLTGLDGRVFVCEYLGIFGRLFILLLTFVILPLIFVSVLNGTAGIGDPKRLGTVGFKSLLYYLCTTGLAVLLGLFLVNVIRPGAGRESLRLDFPGEGVMETADAGSEAAMTRVLILTGLLDPEKGAAFLASQEAQRKEKADAMSLGMRLQEHVLPAVIRNPIMAGQNPLVVILLAIVLGCALAALGKEGLPALHVFQSLDKAFVTIVLWVMRLAPIGVFALMARAISELGMGYMYTLAKYFGTVMLGLGIHFFFLTCILCPLLGGVSPRRFLRAMAPAFQVAFSTSSSSATLPVTLACATKRLGADTNICNFMLPVGATVNMDGTALYLTVASLFIAQVYGISLGFQEQFMVFVTAVLASIGTAGIPGASIGLMSIVLSSAGIPVEGIAIVIGVDRLLDMSRTVVNITGDCVGVVFVSRSEGLVCAATEGQV